MISLSHSYLLTVVFLNLFEFPSSWYWYLYLTFVPSYLFDLMNILHFTQQ